MGSKCDLSITMPASKWVEQTNRRPISLVTPSANSPGHLRPSPAANFASSVQKPANRTELPSSEFSKPPSGRHFGDKILKFLKLRKKSSHDAPSAVSNFQIDSAFQPSLQTFRFQDQTSSAQLAAVHVEDVTERYNYDSDEHSGSATSGGFADRPDTHSICSSAASATSSSRSSSSAQSFASTPRRSFISSSHQSNSQLMATILVSISHLDEDHEACDELSSEDDRRHPTSLDGPHESAWHQSRDDMFAESPARGRHNPGSRNNAAKPGSGRSTPRHDRGLINPHITSPGASRRYGTLDLSRIDKVRR